MKGERGRKVGRLILREKRAGSREGRGKTSLLGLLEGIDFQVLDAETHNPFFSGNLLTCQENWEQTPGFVEKVIQQIWGVSGFSGFRRFLCSLYAPLYLAPISTA